MASPPRLTRTADLEAVRRGGKRFRTSLLEVRYLASLLHVPRIGIIVPRFKHTAVARNRLKRRLREIVRREWVAPLADCPPMDVVVRAHPAAYAADVSQLTTDMRALGGRLSRSALEADAT